MTLKRRVKNSLHYFYALYGAIRYGFPSRKLFVIGITGTSGKSTTAYLLRQLLEGAGYTVGGLSTINFYIAGEDRLNDQKMTMLGRAQNQKFLREMVNKGCDIAIVETTSEGALQHRHRYIEYDMGIFTNLYPEHIDSHGSFDHYKQVKMDILSYFAKSRKKKGTINIPNTLVAPINSEYLKDIVSTGFEQYVLFGRADQELYWDAETAEAPFEQVIAQTVSVTKEGLQLQCDARRLIAPMYGEHNAQNILAVCAAGQALGIPFDQIEQIVRTFRNVPGRVEFISEAEAHKFQIIVDYAFEPVAMKALYEIVDLLASQRIIHVFGSTGGGRDVSRRAALGTYIGARADIAVVTDEDPYDDDPMEIITEVAEAVRKTGKKDGTDLYVILDRKEAIFKAIELAEPDDLVLITGKGSEQGMCIAGGQMIPWDDRAFAREALEKKK